MTLVPMSSTHFLASLMGRSPVTIMGLEEGDRNLMVNVSSFPAATRPMWDSSVRNKCG